MCATVLNLVQVKESMRFKCKYGQFLFLCSNLQYRTIFVIIKRGGGFADSSVLVDVGTPATSCVEGESSTSIADAEGG